MNDTLARKPSDSSSSESTIVPEEIGCSSCIINFLHLRPLHALDAVVDDITKREEDFDMMDPDDVVMTIDASMSLSQEDINVKKPPPSSACQKVETTRPARYQSPLPEDVNARKPSPTTPPPRPRGRTDSLDIITNDYYPPLSAESISAELHHYSSALSIPSLSSRFPPESLPQQQQQQQSHLISTANDDDDNNAPLLSLNAMSMNHANPNEAMLPPIPRINLQMRHSQQIMPFPYLPRVTETDSHRGSRFVADASQQQTAVEIVRQSGVGFVPIQQVDSKEDEDEDEELLAS